MPTHDEDPGFWSDWARLTPEQHASFLRAIREMVEDMKANRPFRAGLRVKHYQRRAGVYEMTWAKDGRALFKYRASQRPGDAHITWLRIGTHDIL